MRYSLKAAAMCVMLLIVLYCSLDLFGEQSEEGKLAQDNSTFALDLFQKLYASEGNIFFSPYSISTALAMTYAGACGNTEKEMAKTLRFSMEQEDLHTTFANIEDRLNKLQKAGNIELSVANSLWPQKDYKLLREYLSLPSRSINIPQPAKPRAHRTEPKL